MAFPDPATRKVTRLGFGLAGALIGAVQRRGGVGSRRTPDHLLLEDAEGMPGPALVVPVADYDRVLPPEEVDPSQAGELALAAGRIVLKGAARRLLDASQALLMRDSRQAAAVAENDVKGAPTEDPAQREAWERFVSALEKVTDLRIACSMDIDELAAEHLRWAEVELEDAVAVAGEFEVKKIRWLLA